MPGEKQKPPDPVGVPGPGGGTQNRPRSTRSNPIGEHQQLSMNPKQAKTTNSDTMDKLKAIQNAKTQASNALLQKENVSVQNSENVNSAPISRPPMTGEEMGDENNPGEAPMDGADPGSAGVAGNPPATTMASLAKKYAQSKQSGEETDPDTFVIKVRRTYVLRNAPPNGFRTWVNHNFPKNVSYVPSKVNIEGNYQHVVQIGWGDIDKDEAAKAEYESAKVLEPKLGNWMVKMTAANDNDLDSHGGIKPRQTKSIILSGVQLPWINIDGGKVMKEQLSEYFVHKEEAKFQLILENGRNTGQVSLVIESYKKVPVREVKIGLPYFDSNNQIKASETSTIDLGIKCMGVDRSNGVELQYVNVPKSCRYCHSPGHLVANCPKKPRKKRLFFCSVCDRYGTCTYDVCSQHDNIKNGIFNEAPTAATGVVFANDPFNRVQEKPKNRSKNKKKSSQPKNSDPKEGDDEFPSLIERTNKAGETRFYEQKNPMSLLNKDKNKKSNSENLSKQAKRPRAEITDKQQPKASKSRNYNVLEVEEINTTDDEMEDENSAINKVNSAEDYVNLVENETARDEVDTQSEDGQDLPLPVRNLDQTQISDPEAGKDHAEKVSESDPEAGKDRTDSIHPVTPTKKNNRAQLPETRISMSATENPDLSKEQANFDNLDEEDRNLLHQMNEKNEANESRTFEEAEAANYTPKFIPEVTNHSLQSSENETDQATNKKKKDKKSLIQKAGDTVGKIYTSAKGSSKPSKKQSHQK